MTLTLTAFRTILGVALCLSLPSVYAKEFQDCPECPVMVEIPAGSFQMGSNADATSKPIHRVSLKSFAMGKTEVTQVQWKAIMGNNPSKFQDCGDNCPVEQVSWDDAKVYIQRLNAKTGKQYRLPSESEWEYACRAGGKHKYCGSDTIDAVAWYKENSDGVSHRVAGKQANAFALYDMEGNVLEWVEDCVNGSYNGAPSDGSAWVSGYCSNRIVRGSSRVNPATSPGVDERGMRAGQTRNYNNVGFRLAMTIRTPVPKTSIGRGTFEG